LRDAPPSTVHNSESNSLAGDRPPLQRCLRHNRQHQSGYQRAQISGRRQYQKPARAAPRQNYSGTEQQASNDAAGKTAARGQLTGSINVKQTQANRGLDRRYRGRKRQQPDGNLRSE
jgi:hypothetical protein